MTYPVKWFSSHDASGAAVAGAPVLSGTPGSLITVLDACRTGYGTVNVASLVVAGGVATATVSAGHGLLDQQIALIAGATPGAPNGEQRITRISATQFSYPTSAADGTAGGAITASVAGAGEWEKSFSGGANLAAYRSTATGATGAYLRIDDTGTRSARLVGYESMISVDSGTGPYPTSAQAAGGLYVAKSSTADTVARPWTLVTDGRFLWLAIGWRSSQPTRRTLYWMGDGVPIAAGDAWMSVLGAHSSDPIAAGDPAAIDFATELRAPTASTSLTGRYALRGHDGSAGSPPVCALMGGLYPTSISSMSFGVTGVAYPDPAVGLLMVPAWIGCVYAGAWRIRGRAPGLAVPLHARPLSGGTVVAAADGHQYIAVDISAYTSAGVETTGQALIDVSGPWR